MYGTLKRGFHNNVFLDNAQYLGEYHTLDKFELYTDASFPIPYLTDSLNPRRLPARVFGNLYRVDEETLRDLDRLEGNGMFYQRRLIRIQNHPRECWAYFILSAEPNKNRQYERIKRLTMPDGTPVLSFMSTPSRPAQKRAPK